MEQSNLEKLSMLDEHGHKMKLYPAEVSGFFRRWRTRVQLVLILVFFCLPWIKINGHQALLLDIANRQFAIFGLSFWAHDTPMVFYVLGLAVIGLATVTALWGRVWCGWGCPQTVFLDGVFRRIERWIEGTHLQRRAFDREPASLKKFFKIALKWLLFFLASTVIAHSFIAYFVGSDRLLVMMQANPSENLTPFLWVFVLSAILCFDFGWFREQFCIIVCPYGRFQSVLLDRNTYTVMYDSARGEPRRGSAQLQSLEGAKQGDCVSCNRCVQVCPTGIDIRNGMQLECVACTACIDACDEIMAKVKKPKGLIRYMSLAGRGLQLKRFRIILYFGLLFAFAIGLSYNIATREPWRAQVFRGLDAPFTTAQMEGGETVIINHLRVQLVNQGFDPLKIQVDLGPQWSNQEVKLSIPENPVTVAPGEFRMLHFFVNFPKAALKNAPKGELIIGGKAYPWELVGPH